MFLHRHSGYHRLRFLQLLTTGQQFRKAVDETDDDGMSPLCLAVTSSQADCVDLLLKNGCSTGPFPAGSLAALIKLAPPSPDMPRLPLVGVRTDNVISFV